MNKEELKNILLDIFKNKINRCIVIVFDDKNHIINFRLVGEYNNMMALNNMIQKDTLLKETLNPYEFKPYNESLSLMDCRIKRKNLQSLLEKLGYLKLYFC